MASPRLSRALIRLRGALLALGVLAAVLAAWHLGFLERPELALLDARFAIRGPLVPDPSIAIVGLDEESAAHYDRRVSSFTRAEFGRAVTNLTEAGASFIVLDVVFARDDPLPPNDAALATALRESGRVILVADVSDRNRSFPIPVLRQEEVGEGFANLIPDRDGVVRRIPPPWLSLRGTEGAGGGPAAQPVSVGGAAAGDEGGAAIFLPLALETAVHHAYPDAPPEVRLGDGGYDFGEIRIRTAGGGIPINFVGGPGSIPSIPFWRAMEGEIPEGAVKDKLVLIGSVHPLQHDQFPVPFRGSVQQATTFDERTEVRQGEMYGIEIHAHALDTILSNRPLVAFGHVDQAAFLILLGLVSGGLFLVLRLKPWTGAFLAAGSLTLIAAAAQYLFTSKGLIVDVLPGILLTGGHFVTGQMYHRALDLRRKREVQALFGRYVSPEVADRMMRDPTLVKLGGRKAVLTMFFSDIRGFTSMSETLPPDEVAALLQEYFTEMTGIVFKHGGTLDKFIGDAIMVFFGDPVPMEDHAERAVLMALEMREAMERLKDRWRSQGRRTFDPGIGINTGEVFVGNTGSARRVSYTVLGDNVNLAARLEANAKAAQILISRTTHDAIAGIETKFVVEPLPPIMVKGKAQPVAIWQVTGRRTA